MNTSRCVFDNEAFTVLIREGDSQGWCPTVSVRNADGEEINTVPVELGPGFFSYARSLRIDDLELIELYLVESVNCWVFGFSVMGNPGFNLWTYKNKPQWAKHR